MMRMDNPILQMTLKILISLCVILAAILIGKRLPSLAGLIAVMPLTGVLAMVLLYSEKGGDPVVMQGYVKGALYGILPCILFYVSALICFKYNLTLPKTLLVSFGVWLAAAGVHQWFLR